MKLSLPDVTLCAVTSVNHELTARAMSKCLALCSFADAVMISDKPVEVPGDVPFRVEIVPHFSGAEYAPFVCRNLGRYTASAYNLLVQYDSYIIEPAAWTNRFLDYDYIGAKWPWHVANRRVGNSGFCLRSKKLLDILAEMPLPPTGEFVDDTFICHTKREWFEKDHGIKIAPDEIADLFSYERHKPEQPTFGFHGIFNFWRHADEKEMAEMIDLMDPLYLPSRAFAEVVFHAYDQRKFPVFFRAYRRLRTPIGLDAIRSHLLQYVKDTSFIDALIRCGEETFTK